MDWVRRHDEYDKAEDSQSCCAELAAGDDFCRVVQGAAFPLA
jgi:hypothetical protein